MIMTETERLEILRAIADYMADADCAGYFDDPRMTDASEERLAKLFNVPKYSDGSGYDFNQFATKPIE